MEAGIRLLGIILVFVGAAVALDYLPGWWNRLTGEAKRRAKDSE